VQKQPNLSNIQIIKRTENAMPTLIQYMGINHGCGNVIMSQERLDGANVRSALQQMGCKGVALMESSP
jgi:hypothetical protein